MYVVRAFFSVGESFHFFLQKPHGGLSSTDLRTKSFNLKVISAKFGVLKFEVSFVEIGRFVKKKALELFSENAKYSYFTTAEGTTDIMVKKFRLIRVATRQEVRDTEN